MNDNVTRWMNRYADANKELAKLKRQKKLLIEDGKRLANEMSDPVLFHGDGDALEQHKELMEKLEVRKKE